MPDDETFEDKVQRHADEDFTNDKETFTPRVKIRIVVEVEDVEVLDRDYFFSNKDEAGAKNWADQMYTIIEDANDNYFKVEEL